MKIHIKGLNNCARCKKEAVVETGSEPNTWVIHCEDPSCDCVPVVYKAKNLKARQNAIDVWNQKGRKVKYTFKQSGSSASTLPLGDRPEKPLRFWLEGLEVGKIVIKANKMNPAAPDTWIVLIKSERKPTTYYPQPWFWATVGGKEFRSRDAAKAYVLDNLNSLWALCYKGNWEPPRESPSRAGNRSKGSPFF